MLKKAIPVLDKCIFASLQDCDIAFIPPKIIQIMTTGNLYFL